MFWKKKNKTQEELKQEAYKKQEAYENLDFIRATKKDEKATIKYFIESEENALEHKIQGFVYPQFHYELAAIAKSTMRNFDDEEIENTFFHLLRLRSWFKPHKNNFATYKKAFARITEILEGEEYHVCHLNRYAAYLVFEVLNSTDKEKIEQVTYEEFIALRKFVLKVSTYTNYPGMQKKKGQFLPFLENEVLMNRARNSIQLFQTYTHKMTIGGVLMLLLLDENEASKDALIQLHHKKQSRKLVWVLGSFYKAFQETKANQFILKNLYANFPKEWITTYEYQQ